MVELNDLIKKIGSMSPEERVRLEQETARHPRWGNALWIPNVGPQTEAYYSKADVLLYGGAGGGGKSDLGLGLAFNEHKRSLVLRRRYSDIGSLIERALEINGTKSGFNGAPPPKLNTSNGKFIQFGANQHPGDEQAFQGRPYDFKCFDEAVHFLESQVNFHLGWLRSSDPEQRCRAVLASNPPVDADGDWIIGMFRPWLDDTHPNPAMPGELRWFVSTDDDPNYEVSGDEVFRDDAGRNCYNLVDRVVIATSRTFIPAKLDDNPILARTNYQARLDALPEPLRSAIRDGNFALSRKDADMQVIPTSWIIEAQARWTPDGWRGRHMTAMAFDPAGGGADAAELLCCYDNWFGKPITNRGEGTADGSTSAAHIVKYRRDNAIVIVDVGGGYGGSVTMRLEDNNIEYVAFNPGQIVTTKTNDRQLRFANKRAEGWWRLREALDPDQEGGADIALPPGPEVRADLAAPIYKLTNRGIVVESKEILRKRLGRSPGKGDVIMMAHYAKYNALRSMLKRGANDRRADGLPKYAIMKQGPLSRKRGR